MVHRLVIHHRLYEADMVGTHSCFGDLAALFRLGSNVKHIVHSMSREKAPTLRAEQSDGLLDQDAGGTAAILTCRLPVPSLHRCLFTAHPHSGIMLPTYKATILTEERAPQMTLFVASPWLMRGPYLKKGGEHA